MSDSFISPYRLMVAVASLLNFSLVSPVQSAPGEDTAKHGSFYFTQKPEWEKSLQGYDVASGQTVEFKPDGKLLMISCLYSRDHAKDAPVPMLNAGYMIKVGTWKARSSATEIDVWYHIAAHEKIAFSPSSKPESTVIHETWKVTGGNSVHSGQQLQLSKGKVLEHVAFVGGMSDVDNLSTRKPYVTLRASSEK